MMGGGEVFLESSPPPPVFSFLRLRGWNLTQTTNNKQRKEKERKRGDTDLQDPRLDVVHARILDPQELPRRNVSDCAKTIRTSLFSLLSSLFFFSLLFYNQYQKSGK
jgi:hypothetical protein